MDSPFWRRVAFGAIVCVLVGLGAYLIGPAAHGSGQSAAAASGGASSTAPPASPAAPAPAAPASGSGSGSGSPATGSGSAGSGSTASGPAGQPDIYQWLPFTQAGLAAAASVVTRFGDAYGTYSYTESAHAYAATLSPLTSAQLTTQIAAAYSTPGVASARASGKQVVTGTATIQSISAFGATSLTFAVQVSQRIASTAGTSQVSTTYSVTLTGGGLNWQVTSVELASVGNS
jgi:hypothetical protein